MIINLDKKTIYRIKNNEEFIFDFNNNICTIIYNQIKLELKLKVLELKIVKNYFFVKYKIEEDCFQIEVKCI